MELMESLLVLKSELSDLPLRLLKLTETPSIIKNTCLKSELSEALYTFLKTIFFHISLVIIIPIKM